jgi:hypothetical protein
MTIDEYRTQLAAVTAKINEIFTTGQSYSVVGSHSVVNPELSQLRAQETILRRKIVQMSGCDVSRTRPNFEG